MLYYIDKNWNGKKYCLCCIILVRTETILSKNIKHNFQNLLFKQLLAQSSDQQTYFGNITRACRHTLVAQNRRESVKLHYWLCYKSIMKDHLDKKLRGLQQRKHQNNVWNLSKVNNKDVPFLTLNRFHTLFWCFHSIPLGLV